MANCAHMDPNLIYVDQINFYSKESSALDIIVFIPFGFSKDRWSVLGALMLKKNRFHQAASRLSNEEKQHIRTLGNWERSRNWEKINDNPEIWAMKNETTGPWLLKIKPEISSRDGKLAPNSKRPRFDARLAPGLYINPFIGDVGSREIGTHIPLEDPLGKKHF